MESTSSSDFAVAQSHIDRFLHGTMRSPGEDVIVVLVPLDAEVDDVRILDDEERARAARFVHDALRRRFVAAHAAVRRVLGACLGLAPEALRFSAGPKGKPQLANSAADLRFNLAHSGEWAMVALAAGRDVGVDIEQQRAVDVRGIVERMFSASERVALDRLSPTDRPAAFYRCWTRKESFIKARGDGLSLRLDAFDVSVEATGAQLLLASRIEPGDVERWRTQSLDAPDGYSAALTVAVSPGAPSRSRHGIPGGDGVG